MAANINTDTPRPNKMVKLAPCEIVIPKLPTNKIALLREALQGLENNIDFSLNLLKIIKSNAEMCVPFKNSFLKTERSADKEPSESTRVYSFASVFVKGVDILKLYLEDPENVPEDEETRKAFQRLAQTILKIEDIGHNLAKTTTPDKKRETDWSIRLVHHLLKQLSVNQQYKIDLNLAKKLYCSCCREPIGKDGLFEDCSIGNSEVWHGSVDILLGQHPDVLVYAKDSDDAIGTDVGGSKEKSNSDERSQIIAETIVFAFLQKKNNPALKNFLTPTVAVSEEDVLFHFYDPEHDMLLESPLFMIWNKSSELYYPTVLALWFILNYKTFCTGITIGMKERNFTADFLSGMEDDIKTLYTKYLQYGDCEIGSVKPNCYKPKPNAGWELDKSRPLLL